MKNQIKNIFVFRLNTDDDLLLSINQFINNNKITKGIVSIIGAVKKGVAGYYDQTKKQYISHTFDMPMEILNAQGNISIKNNIPFAHLHITFSDENGTCTGGHLSEGTIVFAAEVSIIELKGEALIREYDSITGLHIWR